MGKHKSAMLTADSSLPRPIVLRPEDLADVAAAGVATAAFSSRPGGVIIAGGLPAAGALSGASLMV